MDEVKEDKLHEARERYKRCTEAWAKDRDRYKEDVRFAAGYQWHQKDWDDREKDGRPALVVDKIQQYIRQVVNDSRQNRPSIKIRPIDSEADVETADILQGLCKHVEERSSADVAYDTSIECAAKGGFGFIRVLTEYAHDSTFEQELCIKRIRNPLTVSIDPDIKEVDGSDMRYGFVIEQLDKKTFETNYPNADPVNFDVDSSKYPGWYGEEKITIAEYFYIEETPQNLSMLVDGTTATDEEIAAAKEAGIAVVPSTSMLKF